MLRLCYFWFKTQGATDHEAFIRRLDMTSTEKAVDSAFTTDTVTRSQLFYHRDTREISAGGSHRFSVDVFSSSLQTEHERKSHLFRPPIPLIATLPEDEEGGGEEKEEKGEKGEGEQGEEAVVKKEDLIVDTVVKEMAAAEEAKKTAEDKERANNEEKDAPEVSKDDGSTSNDAKEGDNATTDTDTDAKAPPAFLRPPFKSHDTQIQAAFDAKGFDGLKKCHVIRERRVGPNKDRTRYIVLSEPHNEFVVAAIVSDGAVFHFSLDPDDFSLESPNYVGCMNCSFTGTTFTLQDYGMEHELMNTDVLNEGLPGVGFVEHCVVVYDTNILGRVPNAMMVHIPHGRMSEDVDDDLPYHKTEAAEAGLLAVVEQSGPDFSRLQTRKPIWSDDLEAWTMDFHGRVKLASKKNFLLVSENAPTEVLMLFGKVGKSHFSLDFKAPMTVMQAFSIALTSFADKMLVT